DIRAFNYKQQSSLPIYATERVIQALKREFHYVFSDHKYPGIPQIHLHEITNSAFTIGEKVGVTPIEVMHFKLPVLGYRFADFTYITDAKSVPDGEFEKIKGTKVLVINALQ